RTLQSITVQDLPVMM
nr:immunoglobulin heavy chain junction region [Mus musculus]